MVMVMVMMMVMVNPTMNKTMNSKTTGVNFMTTRCSGVVNIVH
jgi:hypothetical protein